MIKRIGYLIRKDILLELRNPYLTSGVFLYLFTCVFIVYKAFNSIDSIVWNALFWILFLFIGISAMLNSFQRESGKSALLYYSLFNPFELLFAKLIFNFFLMLLLSVVLFFVMRIFMPISIPDIPLMILVIILACLGISVNFGFIAAVGAQGSQNATIMSILAFPVVIPILLISIKLSAQAMGLLHDSSYKNDLLMLLGVDAIMLGLSLILFPYLWKS